MREGDPRYVWMSAGWRAGEASWSSGTRTETSTAAPACSCSDLALAEAGASEGAIADALRERDVSLGWAKYAKRSDGDIRYAEIAQKAVEHADAPTIQLTGTVEWRPPTGGAAPRGQPCPGPIRRKPRRSTVWPVKPSRRSCPTPKPTLWPC